MAGGTVHGPAREGGVGTSEPRLTAPPVARPAAPIARPGVVLRRRLLSRIETVGADVIAVVAAPGFGKTTLLTALAERADRPVAWISLDARDDDPAILLADLAFAFDDIHPFEPSVLQRLTTFGSKVPAAGVRELTRSMRAFDGPVLVVLDDVHVLKSLGALDIVSALIEQTPDGWTVAFASRAVPDLSLPRLRARGRLLELGDRDLAMDEEETAQLVRSVDPSIPDATVAAIRRRTEGWPVAVYLASMAIQGQPDPVKAASALRGDDRVIADYVRDELLRLLPKRQLRFMTRTAILRELTPSTCDAVTRSKGSGSILAELERSNPLVVPLPGDPGRYRYHPLFRDVLLDELRRTEPDLVPALYRRAAARSEADGLIAEAIEYAQAGGDAIEAARLVGIIARRYVSGGRLETVARWLRWFDEETVTAYPPLAVVTAWFHAFSGDRDPVRWLRIAEGSSFDGQMPDGSSSFEAAVALLRAALCLDGPERMDEDVASAAELGAPGNEWRVFHHVLAAEAALLVGDVDRARAILLETAEIAGPAQAAGHAMALSQLAAIAADAQAWAEAYGWIDRAKSTATSQGVGDILLQPLMFAVSALVRARRGEPDLARRDLVAAQKLRPTSSFAMPSFSIRGRLYMARAYLALADVEGARTVLTEAREFQSHRPNIGALADALDEVDAEIRRARSSGISGPATLSSSELRVLALLPTHLSFRKIGERLYISNNTVKSHAMSIYHKLGVSSRSDAVERSVELGLLDL